MRNLFKLKLVCYIIFYSQLVKNDVNFNRRLLFFHYILYVTEFRQKQKINSLVCIVHLWSWLRSILWKIHYLGTTSSKPYSLYFTAPVPKCALLISGYQNWPRNASNPIKVIPYNQSKDGGCLCCRGTVAHGVGGGGGAAMPAMFCCFAAMPCPLSHCLHVFFSHAVHSLYDAQCQNRDHGAGYPAP